MHIYLLIQTLQCEQKHIIHESLLQTFNPPVSQLLLCPEWLWCHYKCHSSPMLENLHVRHSVWVIKPSWIFCIFLVLLIIDFISSASLVLYSIIITLIGEEGADLYTVFCQWACTLVCAHFCVCPFGATQKVICNSWCLHFIIIIVVL